MMNELVANFIVLPLLAGLILGIILPRLITQVFRQY